MDKQLNIEKLKSAMDEKGLNQSALAKNLDVSRAIISEWLKGTKFPRPNKLLKIGMTLDVPFRELVIRSSKHEPIVAFRKKGGRKTKNCHVERAKDMGRLLDALAPCLPFSSLTNPPSLKNARLEYRYLQEVAQQVRAQIGASDEAPIKLEDFIKKFNEFDVVLIPVLWGRKLNHENALHIHLPASGTTWIYLNLDSNFHDFNFWLAHELGHVLSQKFEGDEAEDFADAFAQALLFPEKCAASVYKEVSELSTDGNKIKRVIEAANKYDISPITVYESVNSYAAANGLTELALTPGLYAATTNFNKGYHNVSDALGKGRQLSAQSYIALAKDIFESPFFETLKRFLSENEKSPGFIQNILQVDFVDAKGIFRELIA